jgi:hypothetical protein
MISMNLNIERIPSWTAGLLLLAVNLLFPCLTWAWGCTGHEVIALVALDRMDAATRTRLDHALARIPKVYPGRYCTDIDLPAAAYFSTWADDYRTTHAETSDWHYWDVPLEATTATGQQYCEAGCVIRAISEQVAIMKDRNKPDEDRLHALMFVLHFVGDVHQPLHVEDNLDRGGNCVPVDFLGKHAEPRMHGNRATSNYSPNLHSLWDTDLVEYVGGVSPRNRERVQQFAERLNHQYAPEMAEWQRVADPVRWAMESHAAARDQAYKLLPQPIAPLHYSRAIQDCGENQTSSKYAALHEAANAPYVAAVRNEVEMRLAAAGSRLAILLERNWPEDWK